VEEVVAAAVVGTEARMKEVVEDPAATTGIITTTMTDL